MFDEGPRDDEEKKPESEEEEEDMFLVDWKKYFDEEPEEDDSDGSSRRAFEGWITPTYKLPLKRRKAQPVPKTPLGSGAIENSLLRDACAESWCLEKTYSDVNPQAFAGDTLLKSPQKGPLPKISTEVSDIRNLCTLSIELLVPCRPGLPVAEPPYDAVFGIFFALHRDVCVQDEQPDLKGGWTLLGSDLLSLSSRAVEHVDDERQLFEKLIALVLRYDPDILIGYDCDRGSWGYLFERDAIVGSNLVRRISRSSASPLRLSPVDGRILLNLWKICRKELPLRTYSLSNIVLHVLDRRLPELSPQTITKLVESAEPHVISAVIEYAISVAVAQTQILCQLDLFTKTAEMARVYGIQFYEVLSRGSQFRVESMLLRLAASMGFVAASVSPAQRSKMDAAEIIPLNLEPDSGIYRDPVLVLDFQSLYPSIAIAYNYCFTTCLGKLDLFTKTAEMARVYGIQFYEVLSRGSQFRVESMLLRLAASMGFVAASVSPAQRSKMDAAEIIPLNLEPESGIYRDPVLVLDFQSLYPSIAIAYNYCFTTCLGKVGRIVRSHEEGVRQMDLGACGYLFPVSSFPQCLSSFGLKWEEAQKLSKSKALHVTPVGGVFVKKKERRGLLPIMLQEILNTRVMVKKMMKKYADNKRLQRILDARQLALKLVANVTYGYTAANWSGRMPCVEVADAIVSKGRETLERAVQMVKRNAARYGAARVVYGDTDSLFVHLPGVSTEKAFEIGKRIAEDVTADNPFPVKLKFEKVMQPLVLITKKRYVGMSTEEFGDEAVFDAKGIETVRRDGCAFVSKMMEKFLRVLFETNVDTAVHFLRYKLKDVQKYPFSDFVFAKEFRGEYAETAAVPAKKIADKRNAVSERWGPVHGERVSYVVAEGESPDATVISCVLEPTEYFANPRVRLNYDYYVQRQLLPALHRVLHLARIRLVYEHNHKDCYGCNTLGSSPWCCFCIGDPQKMRAAVMDSARDRDKLNTLKRSCRRCTGFNSALGSTSVSCGNTFCPVNDEIAGVKKSLAIEAAGKHDCNTLGSSPWCCICIGDPQKMRAAVMDSARDRDKLNALKRSCRRCTGFSSALGSTSVSCGNTFCPVNDEIAGVRKSLAIEAAGKHEFALSDRVKL
uniref:DNA polymerase n=1 Tax=Steinernema glaseri TaxID=37863 RepID=A0A1I7Z8D9_9BILA